MVAMRVYYVGKVCHEEGLGGWVGGVTWWGGVGPWQTTCNFTTHHLKLLENGKTENDKNRVSPEPRPRLQHWPDISSIDAWEVHMYGSI